ncbi:thermonuclease family protein [Haladaptatus pallidirubidus]|uniref:thermonuclease family protein n=1 Tax=Haladaptatus pallidirubidus TaxID=1008152 RepID=UPI0035E86887
MRRRTFLSALATATASAPISATLSSEVRATSGQISPVECYSTSSFTNASGAELTDSSVITVWAEDSATNNDGDGNGDATLYNSGTSIPVVTAESNVVAFGSTLVEDSTNWQRGNEEFVLNTWDDELGGSGTVLWDNGHGQYYSLGKFSNFESYAEENGYTVTGTSDLAGDLGSADAVVITSPTQSFTTNELRDLDDFIAAGGSVFLHGQSDYSDYDETANMNDIASYLGLSFRFNDDEVLDTTNNGGADYAPLTEEFNTSFDYFADRTGLGLDKDETYTVDVTEVTDGDTATVAFSDGSTESIRILGIDTPEKPASSSAERVQEWEGIESLDYLGTWGDNATAYAQDELDGKTVDLSFDSEEPVRDAFGRVLGYIHYDADGDGTRDDFYNRNAVRDGFARVYGSGFGYHDDFWAAEDAARASGTNVWGESDPENTTEIRNRAVDGLFFPTTASVMTSTGGVADSRVPVYAESTATQNGGYAYSDDIPLAAVDESVNVAMLGSPHRRGLRERRRLRRRYLRLRELRLPDEPHRLPLRYDGRRAHRRRPRSVRRRLRPVERRRRLLPAIPRRRRHLVRAVEQPRYVRPLHLASNRRHDARLGVHAVRNRRPQLVRGGRRRGYPHRRWHGPVERSNEPERPRVRTRFRPATQRRPSDGRFEQHQRRFGDSDDRGFRHLVPAVRGLRRFARRR